MKWIYNHIVLISLLFFFIPAQAQDYWVEKKKSTITEPGRSNAKLPSKFLIFELKMNTLKNIVANSPIRGNTNFKEGVIVYYPLANGSLKAFKVFEAPVFDTQLSARFPNIKSYAGQGIDDPSEIIRFSVSHHGFKGMLISANNGYEFIEPYTESGSNYMVYQRKDRHREESDFECALKDIGNQKIDDSDIRNNADDGTLRSFRLAVSTTGEYTQYHGGTVADALAAMNTSLTRVNGIFETDFNVTLVLINNTSDVIYTNASTDPYSSSSGAWNSQLQSTLTSNIGEANYDVGHLLAQGPNSGNAGCIGCVCVNNQKGSGWTSRAIPEGDPFDVDYLAHELGHQFGGNHTWTHGGNEGTNVQMEPGSGSTIMGYAGITGNTDVQANSDPYFHAISIQQVTNYIKSTSCQSEINTGNSVPTANAGSNYTIPRGTPFILTGTGSDADGDALTYCWEQMDENNASTTFPSVNATSGVAFRSFEPTTSDQRTFPALSTVLTGSTATTWEAVPNVGRNLNFRFTVRDNVAGGGANESDNMVVTVNGSAGPFVLNAPNTNLNWAVGSTQTITWDVAGTDGSPINAGNVNILLSTDGGNTFSTTLASNTPNDGSHSITVPNNVGANNRVKVEATNNIFFDISNTNFTIEDPIPCTATAPTGLNSTTIGASTATLIWNSIPGASSYDVRYRTTGSATWNTNNVGGTTTTLTGLNPLTEYEAQIRSICPDNSNSAYSSSITFTTTEQSIDYCSSNGNNATEEYIGNVTIANINNTTTNSPGGYGDYTSLIANVTQDESVSISITPVWAGTVYNEGYSVWIDYNKDGDFTDAGEQVFTQAPTQTAPVSGAFTIPSSSVLGNTIMRVSMKYNAIPTSCESFTFGEVEDYTVNISAAGCDVGGSCDDGDACTTGDIYDANCNCTGTFADADGDGVCDADDACPGEDDNQDVDGDGIPDGCDNCDGNLEGTACDDGDVCTTGDVYDADCNCTGTFADADGDGVCDANDICPDSDDNQDVDGDGIPDGCDDCDGNLEGTSCDDGDVCTTGDVYDADCNCAGTFADADGDGVCDADDTCPGADDNQDADGDGIPDGCDDCDGNLEGTACDDGDACTTGDVYDVDCNCTGTFADADGDGVCDADDICSGADDNQDGDGDGVPDGCDDCDGNLEGTSCDDGDACTTGDVYDAECNCIGIFADADGDGVCDADDICSGADDNQDGDGDGVPDGCDDCDDNLEGTSCDDGDACTTGDVYDAECNCIGIFADADGDGVCDADDICSGADDNQDGDGDGVPDGCDDCDGNLEGTSCDDGDACTTGDVYDAECNCIGIFADADGDGVCDADDACPGADDNQDGDGDGIPDACDTCDESMVGTACDDGDACTVGDTYDAECNCIGIFADADGDGVCDADDACPGADDNQDTDGDGIPNGCDSCDNNLEGTSCDDGDACTMGDVYDADCNCAGTFQDSDNDGVCDANDICPGGDDNQDGDNDGIPDLCDSCDGNTVGNSCDDGDACTVNDILDANCNCIGTFQDSDNDGVCDANDQCPGSVAGASVNANGCVPGCTDANAHNYNADAQVDDESCETCSDNIQNGDETGIDCGGSCDPCANNYCNSNGNNATEEYIGNVTIAEINNTTTNSAGGYGDYTSLVANLTIGQSTTISITPIWTGTVYNEAYSVWIDYNKDGDFTDPGEQVFTQSPTTASPVSGSFTVPATALEVNTRMRVSMKYNGIPASCESFTYGEVEDYTVSISAPNCTVGDPCDDGDACTTGDVYDANCNCAGTFQDSDSDGVCDTNDQCPGSTAGASVDTNGCVPGCTDANAHNYNADAQADDGSCETCFDNIQNGDETGIDCGGSCDPCSGGCTFQEIDNEDFESGWGIWNDGGSDCRRSANDAAFANSGTYCVRLRDNTSTSNMTTDDINLSNYNEAKIDFTFIAASMDNSNEDLWLQISTNGGSSYTTIRDWDTNIDFVNNVREFEEVTISGPFTSNTRFRFRLDASGNNDRVYIDDVVISACSANSSKGKSKNQSIISLEGDLISNLVLQPNPTRNDVNVLYNASEKSNTTMLIMDVSGKIVLSRKFGNESGLQNKNVDLGALNNGIYYVTLITNKERVTERLVIVK